MMLNETMKPRKLRYSFSIHNYFLGMILYGVVSVSLFLLFFPDGGCFNACLDNRTLNAPYSGFDLPKLPIDETTFEIAVPSCGQSDELVAFSERLGQSFSTFKSKTNIKLLVTKCRDDDFFNEDYVQSLEHTAGGIAIDTVPLNIKGSNLTRGLAFNALSERACNLVGCYFSMVYVDLEIKPLFLENILAYINTTNTIYSPVVWSDYDTSLVRALETISGVIGVREEKRGQWREKDYGIYALSGEAVQSLEKKNDYDWGGEDIELKKLVEKSGLQIVRRHESGLAHRWNPKLCESESVDRRFFGRCLDFPTSNDGLLVQNIREQNQAFFDHLVSLPVGRKREYVDATAWVANAYMKYLKESDDFVAGRIPSVGDFVTYWYDPAFSWQLATVVGENDEDGVLWLNLFFLSDGDTEWKRYNEHRYNAQKTASLKNCSQSLHPSSQNGPAAEVSCRRVHYKAPRAAFEKAGKVIVGVLSSAKNLIQRNVIRDMQANKEASGIVFLVAGPWEDIKEEYLKHQDLIWIDDDEDTSRITYKTAMLLQVVNDMALDLGLNYTHVVKTDDDWYVAVEELEKILEEKDYIDYWGLCSFHHEPSRDPDYKYHVSEEEYSANYFPPYCEGGGVVMSQAMVKCAVHQMANTPFLSMDNVFLGMLAERCGIFPVGAIPEELQVRDVFNLI